MGVDLGSLVSKREINFDYLRGRVLAVDAFNTLYQFLSIIRGVDGSPLMDSRGRITSHLSGLLYRTANIIENEIKPVFVFDGEPSKLKEKTREERKRIRTQAEVKYKEALKEGKLEEARKYAQQAVKLSDEMIDEAKELLRLMGLPVVQAPSEGEAQAAIMASRGKIYACASQDYDALLFGAPILVRNLTVTGKRKLPGRDVYIDIHPEEISLEETLNSLGIDRKKLVWIAILIGTDFNEKFPGIGPKKALQLVKKHSSFEEIIKATGHEPEFDYREVEAIFLEPKYSEDFTIEFRMPDEEGLKRFLCDERNFSEERVSKAIEKIKAALQQKGTQARLDAWFK
ncbi:MAG: flap endonuclease-1 [Candidatus Iainarchaeum archaeon]|uniref:Flap endonuclease 1 n=1 Tax=Candidatus Iainarchaeum sp. TaxID=3101447 RepID=A0A497JFS9_9ARCH|nr:MAG: flap endonuclease-1 [Candidatus Diapherotrites archaeon]